MMWQQFVVILFVFLSLNKTVYAQIKNSYYSDKFYNSSNLQDDDLIQLLNQITGSMHQQREGKTDLMVSDCTKGARCYMHTSVGYNRAKAILLSKYYVIERDGQYLIRDVYCEKEYPVPGPKSIPDSTELNIEHTWPQSRFTGQYSTDLQKADMHHLFPSDSQMNSIRGNYPFGEVEKDEKNLKCQASRYGIGKNGNRIVFEPPPEHKGNVARALFYFSVRYQLRIDDKQEEFLKEWHKDDPVDEEEVKRNNEIFNLQKNRNPFIDMPELVQRIRNF